VATIAASLPLPPRRRLKPLAHWQDRLASGLLFAASIVLTAFLLAPLATILVKSTQDKSGAFVGLQLFSEYVQSPALRVGLPADCLRVL